MAVNLEILQNGQLIETRELDNGRYTIGRDPSADIVLDSKTVSKNHATLIIDSESFRVIDNDSANGVYCRGKKISEKAFTNDLQIELTPFTIRTAVRKKSAVTGEKAVLSDSVGFFINSNMTIGLFAVIALAMFFSLVTVYVPLKNRAETAVRQERLRNGTFLCRYLAEINRPFLETDDHALVRAGTVQQEEGVLYAFVIDSHGRIIAPHEKQGDFFNWDGLPQALSEARPRTDKGVRGESLIFNPVMHQNQLLGAAVIGFSTDKAGDDGDIVLGGGSIFLLLVFFGLAIATAYLLARNYVNQLKLFSEEVEVAIKEGRDHIEFQAPYEELDHLRQIINRLLLRKGSDAGSPDAGEKLSAGEIARPPENEPARKPVDQAASSQSPPAGRRQAAAPAGPWCLINTGDYTLIEFSDTFTRALGLKACHQGMHVIEAFDGDVIMAVTQIIENTDASPLETEAAGKKYRVTGSSQDKNRATVLIVFEDIE